MALLAQTSQLVTYNLLDEGHLDECISIMTDIFSRSEPLTRLLGINETEFSYFAEIFAAKAIEEELGVFAREHGSKRILGFCISEDLLSCPPPEADRISPKFLPIMALVNQLDSWFLSRYQARKGDYLHIFMTGISKYCRHREVSLGVVAESLRIAEVRGYRGALGESTNVLAARAAARNGFSELYAIPYSNFSFEGKAVFAEMGSHSSCRLMAKWFT